MAIVATPGDIARGQPIDGRARPARDPEAGGLSPGVIIFLLLIVALFVFALLASSRGGLSSGGGLPTDAKGRQALFDRWFAPATLAPGEMKLTHCTLSGKLLAVNGTCVIEVPTLPAPPRSWKEKIAAAFHGYRRRLFIKPLSPPVHMTLFKASPDQGPPPDPLEADLKNQNQTDVTFAPDGVRRLELSCTCKLDLSGPTEEQ